MRDGGEKIMAALLGQFVSDGRRRTACPPLLKQNSAPVVRRLFPPVL